MNFTSSGFTFDDVNLHFLDSMIQVYPLIVVVYITVILISVYIIGLYMVALAKDKPQESLIVAISKPIAVAVSSGIFLILLTCLLAWAMDWEKGVYHSDVVVTDINPSQPGNSNSPLDISIEYPDGNSTMLKNVYIPESSVNTGDDLSLSTSEIYACYTQYENYDNDFIPVDAINSAQKTRQLSFDLCHTSYDVIVSVNGEVVPQGQ